MELTGESGDYYSLWTINFLSFLWFLFPVALVIQKLQVVVATTIILTLPLSLLVFGTSWLKKYEFPKFLLISLSLFLGCTLLPQFFPFRLALALDSIRDFHGKIILLFLGTLFVFRNNTLRRAFLWGCVASMFIAASFGYWEHFMGLEWLPWERNPEWPEALSPFGYHKNDFGAYLSYFLPIIFAFGIGLYKNQQENFYRLTIPLITFAYTLPILVLSLSRAAQGGFVVAMMVFFGLTFLYSEIDRVYKISSASVIGLGFLTSFWLIPESMLKRLTLNELSSSFEGRISIWETYWNQLEGNLMYGLNFSRDLTEEFINAPTHEHNMYLRFITDSGIMGFIGFMVLFSSVFVLAIFNIKKKSNFLRLIHFGILSSFIGPLLIRSIVAKRYEFYLELLVSLLIASSLLNSNYTSSRKNKSVESSKT